MIGNPPIKPEMAVEKIFVISTAHAKPEHISDAWGNMLPYFLFEDEYMSMFYVPDMESLEAVTEEQSYFKEVLRMAHSLGCNKVAFDEAGYIVEGLKLFEAEWNM